ncbi:hypothetical protein GCM10020227_54720 [Streptomyces flavovirens]
MAAASEFVTSRGFVDAPDGRADAEFRGVSAEGVRQSLDLRPVAGSLAGLHGDTVALSDKKAEEYGVGIGDRLPLRLGDGTAVRPTVVALYADNPKQQYVTLPAATLAPHTSDGLPHQILARSEPGGGPGVREALAALAASVPGTELDDGDSLAGRNTRFSRSWSPRNYTIVAMIVGYAAITVVNTLVAVTRKRPRRVRPPAADGGDAPSGARHAHRRGRPHRDHRHRPRHDRLGGHHRALQHGQG